MVARGRVHSRRNLGEGQQHKILPEKQKTLLNFPWYPKNCVQKKSMIMYI